MASIRYGHSEIQLRIAPGREISTRRRGEPVAILDPATLVRDALEQPNDFPPLRQALTPDDHIAVVVDARLPGVQQLLVPVLQYIEALGFPPAQVKVVVAPIAPTLIELEDTVHGITVERHDPEDRKGLAYVATTAGGRRVYLNRTVVEADQIVTLAEVRHDPRGGLTGGPGTLFPALSDTATRHQLASVSSAKCSDEANEVCWLLGLPFFLHVIAGAGEGVAGVIGGPAEAHRLARETLRDLWVLQVERCADIVIASLGGDPRRHSVTELATALTHATLVLKPGGTLVLLTEAAPDLGEAFARTRNADTPESARTKQFREYADDEALQLWLRAVQRHRVMLLSRWDDEITEDLFATPLQNAGQVQRLVDTAGDCLVLEDAQRAFPTLRHS